MEKFSRLCVFILILCIAAGCGGPVPVGDPITPEQCDRFYTRLLESMGSAKAYAEANPDPGTGGSGSFAAQNLAPPRGSSSPRGSMAWVGPDSGGWYRCTGISYGEGTLVVSLRYFEATRTAEFEAVLTLADGSQIKYSAEATFVFDETGAPMPTDGWIRVLIESPDDALIFGRRYAIDDIEVVALADPEFKTAYGVENILTGSVTHSVYLKIGGIWVYNDYAFATFDAYVEEETNGQVLYLEGTRDLDLNGPNPALDFLVQIELYIEE